MTHYIRANDPSAGNERGFSLLELVVVICIIAVLTGLAAERTQSMRATSERVAAETLISNIKTALNLRATQLLAKGNTAGVIALTQESPIALLTEPPETYRGAFFGVDPTLFKPGDWYFDRKLHALVYLPRFEEQVDPDQPPPPRVAYVLSIVYEDVNGNKAFDPGIEQPAGVRISQSREFRWLEK